MVIGAPDSGLDAALGYAEESGIPYGVGFIKNKYIGRTFIQGSQKQRESSVRLKLNVIASTVRASKVRRIMDNWETDFLTAAEGWYLGTSAGAAFFGAKPGFAVGEPLHALVLDDSALPPLSAPEDRLSRFLSRRQAGAVRAVWSAGRRVV